VVSRSDVQRLICYPIILLSLLLAVVFDWHAHLASVARYGGAAPGDFLTFRGNAILAARIHAHIVPVSPLLYPPPFLLFTTPVSLLPPVPGYIAWIAVSSICLVLAAKISGLTWPQIGLGLLAPPNLFAALMGQSGILVSAFLVAALGLAKSRPILAGIAAGALIIKPQFGILLPVCFLASRNWRAMGAAALTVAVLSLLATLCFGKEVWQSFEMRHIADAQNMLLQPWRAEFQLTMITPFIMLRSLYASLHIAGAAQLLVSISACFACWRLWRLDIAPLERLAPTLCLIALTTPYAYIYDIPCLGFALAALAFGSWARPQALWALALLFAFTCLYAIISVFFISTGALFMIAILILAWPYGATAVRSADTEQNRYSGCDALKA